MAKPSYQAGDYIDLAPTATREKRDREEVQQSIDYARQEKERYEMPGEDISLMGALRGIGKLAGVLIYVALTVGLVYAILLFIAQGLIAL